MSNEYCVVTTINSPTKAIEVLYEKFGNKLLIVEDNKTPRDWEYKDVPVFGGSGIAYAPFNHYARKNLGYMEAIKNKATLIFDTDDDNIPNENWEIRSDFANANEAIGKGWVNVYKLLSEEEILWARGFPLNRIHDVPVCGHSRWWQSSIQQGMADGEPDVDAIWRLVFKKQHNFANKKSVYLHPNMWHPFNSQVTWWFPKAFALMYLPVTVSFRMTDIWRSFIAQKCLWELGEGIIFHSPSEVFQDRNEHDLMKDFEDEIDGYKYNDEIARILQDLKLKSGQDYVCENLLTCYQSLVDKRMIKSEEIISVQSWINDYNKFGRI